MTLALVGVAKNIKNVALPWPKRWDTYMARPQIFRQIRRFCLDCQGNASAAVKNCSDEQCALWSLRCQENTLDKKTAQESPTLPLLEKPSEKNQEDRKALRTIRQHCLACAGHRTDVRMCTAKEECALWSLRFGVYPATYKRVRERLAQGRQRSLFD